MKPAREKGAIVLEKKRYGGRSKRIRAARRVSIGKKRGQINRKIRLQREVLYISIYLVNSY